MITFTVITCTYNAAEVLQRTLDSVAAQSYQHVQHVIVDGLSKDDTMSMVRAYQEKHIGKDVLVVSEKDSGLYDAMNKGIRLAQGMFLVFLNAGDTFHDSDTLKDIAAQCDGTEGVIYGNTDVVDSAGRFLHQRRLQPPEVLTWRSFRDGMLVCHQAFYARTEIAKKVPYDLKYRFSADVDWCIRIMKESEGRGLTLRNTHLTLCNFLDGGMTTANHRASLIERFKVMAHHYGMAGTILKHISFLFR